MLAAKNIGKFSDRTLIGQIITIQTLSINTFKCNRIYLLNLSEFSHPNTHFANVFPAKIYATWYVLLTFKNVCDTIIA